MNDQAMGYLFLVFTILVAALLAASVANTIVNYALLEAIKEALRTPAPVETVMKSRKRLHDRIVPGR